MEVLKINGLSKKYGHIQAVNQLSFSVKKGEICGMLGPNGSGKTTTLGMVLGIIHPDEGSYSWFNEGRSDALRKRVGAILETPNFYPYLDADRNLQIYAHIKGIKENKFDDLLELVKLKDRRTSNFKTYSLGMKQRLAIACALLGDPDVLIFDEPTNGLDPQGIAEIRETIIAIAERGKTILIASHILDEIEKICSHVVIIKKGELLATGPVGAIISNDQLVEIAAQDLERLKKILSETSMISDLKEQDGKLQLFLKDEFSGTDLNQHCMDKGLTLSHLVVRKKSLEAEFLELTSSNN